MINKSFFVALVALFYTGIIIAQTYTGKVMDENNQPIAYANVVLLTQSDSTFIAGEITDKNGLFCINKNNPNQETCLLKISHIGYITETYTIKDNNFDKTIQMKEETNALKEVVVKARKPVYEMKAGALIAQIKGTILSHLGTGLDVLKQLPFLSSKGSGIEVFGRGAPLIYLNNRILRNNNELSQIKSEQIKNIEVIMNPGSQYSSSVNAVIKITTLRMEGDGFGGSLSIRGKQKTKFVHNELLDLNYRKRNWDFFGMLSYYNDKWRQKQTNNLSFSFDKKFFTAKETGKIGFQHDKIELTGGVNYADGKTTSLGVRYSYSQNFETPAYVRFYSEFKNSEELLHSYNNNEKEQGGHTHYLNAYYRKQFKNKSSINLDGTFVKGDNFLNAVSTEEKDGLNFIVPSQSNSQSDLYALRLWGTMQVAGGTLELGSEFTNTKNNQTYFMMNEDLLENLPNNLTEAKQNALSSYLFYSKNWSFISLNAGLRYEFVDFDYAVNNIKRDEESKIYNNIFPSLSFSFKKNGLSMSFNYRTTIVRPSYGQLRSSISYNNYFSYEGGNPTLKRNINHRLGILLNYGDLLLDCNYTFRNDDIMLYQQLYNNKPIILSSFINQDKRLFEAVMSYSPSISFWKPSFTLGISAQNMHFVGRSYNKPIFTYVWRNMFTFPKKWIMTFNINGYSYGNTDFVIYHPTLNSEISIKKSFGKSLDLHFGITDVFNSYRETWRMCTGNDIIFDKWNSSDNRSAYLKVIIKINKTSNKYRGGSSGNSEKSRL